MDTEEQKFKVIFCYIASERPKEKRRRKKGDGSMQGRKEGRERKEESMGDIEVPKQRSPSTMRSPESTRVLS